MDCQTLLLGAAQSYAAHLSKRPGVEGIFLYGSVAYGTAGQFSDVDIAVVLPAPLPDYPIEHRLFESTKVDVVAVTSEALKAAGTKRPFSPPDNVPWFILRSLLLGGPQSVLYDPDGRITSVKRALSDISWIRHLAAPWCLNWLRVDITKMVGRAKDAPLPEARGLLAQVLSCLNQTLGLLSVEKRAVVTAEALGIVNYAEAAAEIANAVAPEPERLSALIQAYRQFWSYTLAQAHTPIRQRLLGMGISDPEKLELAGDYGIYWPGPRIHELGRVLAEVDLALRWSEFAVRNGDAMTAWGLLGWTSGPGTTKRRWQAIAAALGDAGFAVSDIVEKMVADTTFKRLATAAEGAYQHAQQKVVSEAQIRRAVQQAEELCNRMEAVLTRLASGSG